MINDGVDNHGYLQGVTAFTTAVRETHLEGRFRDKFRSCCVFFTLQVARYPAMEGVSAVKGMFETNASASLTTSGVPAPRRKANWVADFSNEIFRVDSLTLVRVVFNLLCSFLFRPLCCCLGDFCPFRGAEEGRKLKRL